MDELHEDVWLSATPSSLAALERDDARFLEVGGGVAAMSVRLCRRYPGLVATAIDTSTYVLGRALRLVQDHGLGRRVELREQAVTDLGDDSVYDLALLEADAASRPTLGVSVRRVHTALRPDRWVAVPLPRTGAADDVTAALESAGFVDLCRLSGPRPAVLARRPSVVSPIS